MPVSDRLDFDTVREQARGRWPAILQAAGVDPKYLRLNVHQPCPACGGRDRYRFDDKDGDGRYYCARCGAGDGFQLIERVLHVSRAEALRTVARLLGVDRVRNAPARAPAVEDGGEASRRAMQRIRDALAGAQELRRGDLVHRYLTGRGLPARRWDNLGFHPNLRGRGVDGAPAMLAKVHSPEGHVQTLHRTFLDAATARKLPGVEAKQLMPVIKTKARPTWLGGAVRLYPVNERAQGRLVLAEGIETALAAAEVFSAPAWACLTAGGLAAWEPPAGLAVRRVIIAADHDDGTVERDGRQVRNLAGHEAAFTLAARLARLGIVAEVVAPEVPGTDWLDVLTLGRGVAAA